MAAPQLNRTIVFESDGSYRVPEGISIAERGRIGANTHPSELIQPRPYAEPIYQEDSAETVDAPESPVTLEMILDEFPHAVSVEIGNALFDTVPGSIRHKEVFAEAKTQITSHYLWRMGLPSELGRVIDIDNHETRSLLQEEYAKIPEETGRDNSANSFRRRWERVMEHVDEHGSDENVQDVIEIWREDLRIRREVTADASEQQKTVAHKQRDVFFEEYLAGDKPHHQLMLKIGNTLLVAEDIEVEQFVEEVARTPVSNPDCRERIEQLQSFVVENFTRGTTE